MLSQLSHINQQQLILILGIVIIILLLIDAYRRSRRKKYKASSAVAHSRGSATDKEDSDQADKKEHKQQEAQSEEQSDNDDQSQSSAETVKEDGEPVSEVNETDHQESQPSEQASAEENPAPETDKAVKSVEDDKQEKEPEPEPELKPEPEPEPKTWEEALAAKRRQQMESNHKKYTSSADQSKQSSDSDDDKSDTTVSTAIKDGIIVIHIMAPRHYVFYGEDLQAVFDHYQLSYNAEIQAYQGISEDGEVLFHVATATKPGTFNINTMDQLQTPGISVFMDIQALSDPKNQFKQMLSLLYKMSENLGGMLLNEYRNRFTQNDVSRIIASIKNIQHDS